MVRWALGGLSHQAVVLWLSGAPTVSLSHKCPERLRVGLATELIVVGGFQVRSCDVMLR